MYRILVIALCCFLGSCKTIPGFDKPLRTEIEPVNVPICDTRVEYPGFRGGGVHLGNYVTAGVGPYHYNDMMYVMLGPKSQMNMVVARVTAKNTGTRTISIDRSIVRVVGEDGSSASSIPPENILIISRTTGVDSDNPFHQMGDGIIDKEFKKIAEVGTDEVESIMAAFPLPLPKNPIFVITIDGYSGEVPICWGR